MSDALIGAISSVVLRNNGGVKFTDIIKEILIEDAKTKITGLHNVGDLDIPQILYNCVKSNDMLKICEYSTHPSFDYKKYFVYIPLPKKNKDD